MKKLGERRFSSENIEGGEFFWSDVNLEAMFLAYRHTLCGEHGERSWRKISKQEDNTFPYHLLVTGIGSVDFVVIACVYRMMNPHLLPWCTKASLVVV